MIDSRIVATKDQPGIGFMIIITISTGYEVWQFHYKSETWRILAVVNDETTALSWLGGSDDIP